MIVGLFGALFPFVNASAANFGSDGLLRCHMFRQIAVLFGVTSEDGQTVAISCRHAQSRVDKRLPKVGVMDNVADRPFAVDVGNAPVESHAITWLALRLAERQA